jgi:hypothetical protein
MILAWWTKRSTMAETATASPKTSVQLLNGLFAAQDEAGAFLAAGNDGVEQRGGLGLERDVVDFVADQQRDAAELVQFGVEAAGASGGVEPPDPLSRARTSSCRPGSGRSRTSSFLLGRDRPGVRRCP